MDALDALLSLISRAKEDHDPTAVTVKSCLGTMLFNFSSTQVPQMSVFANFGTKTLDTLPTTSVTWPSTFATLTT